MLWTCFVTLLFCWMLALMTSFTLSGFIHLLPAIAAIIAVTGTMQNRQLAK